ncbi:MAG TPA: transglutaminase-like domain-containing protein [Terriglobales bacterium]|nr:transglutaminase-like domain-containing protein [Terriglobales bacterium]
MSDGRNPGLREEFSLLVSHDIDEDRISLERAALTIARTEYPHLDVERYIRVLDRLGRRVAALLPSLADAQQTIQCLNRVMFEEEGFSGNTEDYYDPRNSFLNDVLDRKVGIPITLALVYMEVAQRVGFPLFGVGMPGHFLLKHYDVDGRETLIDAFQRGSILTHEQCQQRLDHIYAGHLPLQPEFLHTVSRRQMLTRMLNNLRNIYLTRRDLRRALLVVDLVLAVYPRSPEDMKQRAQLRFALGQLRAAADDFDTYVRMSPDASDADEVRQAALSIRRRLALMN